jgi:hypothetical protein
MLCCATTVIALIISFIMYLVRLPSGFIGGTPMTDSQRKIAKKYKKYKIPKKRAPFREFCYPKEFKIQPQQEFLGQYMAPSAKPKTILINHLIGAGKSIAIIEIAEKWKDRGKPLILMPASLIAGFRDELGREELRERYPDFSENSVVIMSFNKFAESSGLKAPILLIDESQNLSNENGEYFNSVMKFIDARLDLSVVLLTGTPIFDNPSELNATARMLRINLGNNKGQLPTPDQVRKKFSGHVSFFAGAPDYTFPEAHINIITCKMSAFQTKWYLSEVEAELKKNGDGRVFSEIANNFCIKSRQRSNIVFPSGLSGDDGLRALTPHIINEKLATYSAKYAKMFKKLGKGRLAFIYIDFTNEYGIASIIKCLKLYGYKDYLKSGVGRKRYSLFTGEQSMKEKGEIRRIFNSRENDNAEKIQIIIGSPAIKSGVNLTRIRDVHVLSPYWNWSHLQQVIGRAIRFCSHKTLPKELRRVEIYIYCAITADYRDGDKITIDNSVDLYMLEIADRKKEEAEPYIKALMDSAVDRGLFQ